MTYTMADWLSLHELDLQSCQTISERIKQLGTSFRLPIDHSQFATTHIPVELAWELVCEAYRARYQDQDAMLRIIACEVAVNLSSQVNARNFVTEQHGADYPLITIAFRGRPLDVLTLAHEFAHATQCVVSQGRFVAPALRELCAFSGELILLRYLLENNSSLYRDVAIHWLKFNELYFGQYLTAFETALLNSQTPYRYEWNYPIARFISICSHYEAKSTRFWCDFSGRASFNSVKESVVSCALPRDCSLERMISS